MRARLTNQWMGKLAGVDDDPAGAILEYVVSRRAPLDEARELNMPTKKIIDAGDVALREDVVALLP
jgi:hypothetical protein